MNIKDTTAAIAAAKGYHHGAGIITTKSDLQKWLRVDNEIHIEIRRETIGSDEWAFSYRIDYLPKEHWEEKRRCGFFKEKNPFYIGVGTYAYAWDTYEEALEEALLAGLNLI